MGRGGVTITYTASITLSEAQERQAVPVAAPATQPLDKADVRSWQVGYLGCVMDRWIDQRAWRTGNGIGTDERTVLVFKMDSPGHILEISKNKVHRLDST